jgi:hypothetical protein
MRNCTVCNGDDAVAVATYDPKGRSGYVLVEGCIFCNGSHGASIGSRVVGGGVHNVTVRNVRFLQTENAARVKAVAGTAGSVAHILYENITAIDVGNVLIIDALYKSVSHRKEASSEQATITRVTFRDIVGRGATHAGYFKCQPSSPCTHVQLEDIDITVSGGKSAEFQCESAYGTAKKTAPQSCLLPVHTVGVPRPANARLLTDDKPSPVFVRTNPLKLLEPLQKVHHSTYLPLNYLNTSDPSYLDGVSKQRFFKVVLAELSDMIAARAGGLRLRAYHWFLPNHSSRF